MPHADDDERDEPLPGCIVVVAAYITVLSPLLPSPPESMTTRGWCLASALKLNILLLKAKAKAVL